MNLKTLIATVVLGSLSLPCAANAQPAKVIDVHLHSYPEESALPPVPYRGPDMQFAAPPPSTGALHREATIEAMKRNNVVLAMVSPGQGDNFELSKVWQRSGGPEIRPGMNQSLLLDGTPPEQLAEHFRNGDFFVMGELGLQYRGRTLDEEDFAPYLKMAEAEGIPVAIHTGLAPPEQARGGNPDFRVHYGNPLHLEEVLIRYPDLKIWAMHAGFPWGSEMTAMMQQYENLYVDLTPLIWIASEKVFYDWLEGMMDMEFGDRILFGTDQMLWPTAIDAAVARIENAPMLTREQKDDIFFNNAVRFFGLEQWAAALPDAD